jgi:hypothetical protein
MKNIRTIIVPAEYRNKKLKPLTPLPSNGYYEAIILILQKVTKRKKRAIDIKPISLGKEKLSLTRNSIYDTYR